MSGACINLTDCAGWTPLHVAAYYDRASAVNELLQHGADYALANRRGETPWDLAGNDSTQHIFQKHCQDSDYEIFTTRRQVDLSSLELANVLQTMRHEQTTPIIEESNSAAQPISWGIITPPINNQLYQNPSNILMAKCIKIFNSEPLKGFSYFIALGCITTNAKEIAKFLLQENNLKKASIGFILGENTWFHKDIALEFMSGAAFNGENIIVALRKVIAKCKFPEEGARINNILQAFSHVYSKENAYFGGPDAVQGLSFSILMIELEGLDKQDFFKSTSGLLEGKDYPHSLISWIYDEIYKNPLGLCKKTRKKEKKIEGFDEFSIEGYVIIHKKCLKVALCDDILFFLSQINNSPYAIAILKDCEISDSWLQGSVVIKSSKGILTAKFTKEGKVKIKRESMLVFKSDDWKKWMEAIAKSI